MLTPFSVFDNKKEKEPRIAFRKMKPLYAHRIAGISCDYNKEGLAVKTTLNLYNSKLVSRYCCFGYLFDFVHGGGLFTSQTTLKYLNEVVQSPYRAFHASGKKLTFAGVPISYKHGIDVHYAVDPTCGMLPSARKGMDTKIPYRKNTTKRISSEPLAASWFFGLFVSQLAEYVIRKKAYQATSFTYKCGGEVADNLSKQPLLRARGLCHLYDGAFVVDGLKRELFHPTGELIYGEGICRKDTSMYNLTNWDTSADGGKGASLLNRYVRALQELLGNTYDVYEASRLVNYECGDYLTQGILENMLVLSTINRPVNYTRDYFNQVKDAVILCKEKLRNEVLFTRDGADDSPSLAHAFCGLTLYEASITYEYITKLYSNDIYGSVFSDLGDAIGPKLHIIPENKLTYYAIAANIKTGLPETINS